LPLVLFGCNHSPPVTRPPPLPGWFSGKSGETNILEAWQVCTGKKARINIGIRENISRKKECSIQAGQNDGSEAAFVFFYPIDSYRKFLINAISVNGFCRGGVQSSVPQNRFLAVPFSPIP
jgi:hypothetical protein